MKSKSEIQIPDRKIIEIWNKVPFEQINQLLIEVGFELKNRDSRNHMGTWAYKSIDDLFLTPGKVPALTTTYHERERFEKEGVYPTISLACWEYRKKEMETVLAKRDEVYHMIRNELKSNLVENNKKLI